MALGLWAIAHFGGDYARPCGQLLWHAHEMIFGFAAAMCGGFILTALPSWAGTAAITGWRLKLLVGVWGLGRIAMLAAPLLPGALTAFLDMAFVPLLLAMAGPQAWGARNRHYRWLIPILAWLAGGNLVFHLGTLGRNPDIAHLGIRAAYYALMVLFSFVGGLLTPIFTESRLRDGDSTATIPFYRPVEILAPAGLAVTAVAEFAGLGGPIIGGAALATAVIHAWRMASWRTTSILSSPLLAAMHVGYACLIASLVLQAITALGGGVAPSASVHAFTIGAMGLTKISLMTRVALKHTGRDLRLPTAMIVGFFCMGFAALFRVFAETGAMLAVSATLWAMAILIYLGHYGRYLVRPSLPRRPAPAAGEAGG